jgi:phage-related protein
MLNRWEVVFRDYELFLKQISSLSRTIRYQVLSFVINELQQFGPGLAREKHGRALGSGLYELKVEMRPEVLLRVFFCVKEGKVILVLSAYDKKRNDSKSWQGKQISRARKLMKALDSK